MIQPRKLDNRGIAHFALLMIIVLGVGIFGAYKLIASKAAVPGATNGSQILERNMSIWGTSGQYLGALAPAGVPNAHSPSWSHDGKQIVFWSHNYANASDPANGIYIANSDGTSPRKIYTGPNTWGGLAKWSPDGTRIAFVGPSTATSAAINVIKLSDASRSIVSNTNGINGSLAWAPDSNSIAYINSYNTQTEGRLCTITVTGTNKQCFSATASGSSGLSNPTWSPDGATIAFEIAQYTASSTGESVFNTDIYSIKRDGSGYKLLIADAMQPDYSPDGTKIVFNACADYSSGPVCGGNGGIKIATANGSILQVVTSGGSTSDYPQWQPIPPVSPVSAPDLTSPTTAITSPANGSTVSGTIPVSILASDNRAITKVDIYLDGILKASDTTAPYCIAGETNGACNGWDTKTLADGTYALHAKSYDAAGNTGMSSTITIKVANTVALTYTGTCSVTGVSDTVKKGTSFNPLVTVRNTGTGTFTPSIKTTVTLGTSTVGLSGGTAFSSLAAGASQTVSTGSYTVPKTTKATSGSVTATSTTVVNGKNVAFSCTKGFTIPKR